MSFFRNGASNRVLFALAAIGELLLLALVLHTGIAIGEREAFARMHGGRSVSALFGFLPHGFFPEGHGAVGEILAASSSLLTLQTRDGEQEQVRLASSTLIESRSGTRTTPAALTPGTTIVVIGEPEEDAEVIDARIIRMAQP